MIQAYVDRFMTKSEAIKADFAAAPKDYYNYQDLVAIVVIAIAVDEYDDPDFKRIHQIDDGDYQGTLVFVIGAGGYQPSTYWYVKVGYGSCSGCDTLQSVLDDSGEERVDGLYTLCLHILQGLKRMGDD